MKILIIYIFFSLFIFHGHSQTSMWHSTKNWKIYAGEGQQVFSYPVDTLRLLPNQILSQDSIQYFLNKVNLLSADRIPTWMGSYLASYESTDGITHKVEISIYGGFFYDQTTAKYYQIPRELTSHWLTYVVENMKNIRK